MPGSVVCGQRRVPPSTPPDALQNPRLDLITISGHKIYAPQGMGALVMRRQGYVRPPRRALVYGGGQERGLRPGTRPVALIVALGLAAEIALRDHAWRRQSCRTIWEQALQALAPLNPKLTGHQALVMDHVLNLAFPGLDSEALMVAALKDLIAISNGSACISTRYTPSPVLKAMGLDDDQTSACVCIRWSHWTPAVDWEAVTARIRVLR